MMDMVITLQKAIPNSEVKRIFSEFIQAHEDWLSNESRKQILESELLWREKEMRVLSKQDQLAPQLISMWWEIEGMREDLWMLDSSIDMLKNQLRGLKDEMRCIEIYEKRKTDLAFDLEKNFIAVKEENENLWREFQFILQAKNDIEKAYKAVLEDRRLIDWELGTMRA